MFRLAFIINTIFMFRLVLVLVLISKEAIYNNILINLFMQNQMSKNVKQCTVTYVPVAFPPV